MSTSMPSVPMANPPCGEVSTSRMNRAWQRPLRPLLAPRPRRHNKRDAIMVALRCFDNRNVFFWWWFLGDIFLFEEYVVNLYSMPSQRSKWWCFLLGFGFCKTLFWFIMLLVQRFGIPEALGLHRPPKRTYFLMKKSFKKLTLNNGETVKSFWQSHDGSMRLVYLPYMTT